MKATIESSIASVSQRSCSWITDYARGLLGQRAYCSPRSDPPSLTRLARETADSVPRNGRKRAHELLCCRVSPQTLGHARQTTDQLRRRTRHSGRDSRCELSSKRNKCADECFGFLLAFRVRGSIAEMGHQRFTRES